jgi:putative ABC transport system ATP-binding protein
MSVMKSILEIYELSKVYHNGNKELKVLQNINFSISENATLAIVGPSGSGKTTLLGLAAGLDYPSSGKVILNQTEISNLSQEDLAKIRNKDIGFIFQNFQLLPTLTAIENVMVPLELQGAKNIKEQAINLLKKVGLESRMDHYPLELSGGEQQRVAIARAFINSPKILFADEPTGNLDSETSELIVDLLFQLNKNLGTTLVLVTHDLDLAKKTNRIIELKGGSLLKDTKLKEIKNED